MRRYFWRCTSLGQGNVTEKFGRSWVSCRPHLNNPRHILTTFRARSDQQQITSLDSTGEIPDGHLATTVTAPHVGEQALLGFSRNGCPKVGGLGRERGWGLDGHGNKSSACPPPNPTRTRLPYAVTAVQKHKSPSRGRASDGTLEHLERDKRFELSTYTLARYRSTN